MTRQSRNTSAFEKTRTRIIDARNREDRIRSRLGFHRLVQHRPRASFSERHPLRQVANCTEPARYFVCQLRKKSSDAQICMTARCFLSHADPVSVLATRCLTDRPRSLRTGIGCHWRLVHQCSSNQADTPRSNRVQNTISTYATANPMWTRANGTANLTNPTNESLIS